MRLHNVNDQKSLSPKVALDFLKQGNKRFVANLKAHSNLLEQVNDTKANQFPFAIILSCIDSRTSAELIFDQGLGDIFSIRNAGNALKWTYTQSYPLYPQKTMWRTVFSTGENKTNVL